ncbi:MAG: MCE family protein [Spirochaetales bacterium]|nr:MCE family protein [Spirochaetales bacterium]
MKFRLRFAEQITGLFVLIAIGMIALVLVFMGINKRWYVDDPVFFTKFESAEGLKTAMAIRFKGFQIGQIDALQLLDDDTVEVRFTIYREYHSRVRENTVIEFATNPLNLGGGLLLHPGKYVTAPKPSGSYIPSLDFADGIKLVKDGLVETKSSDEISVMMGNVGDILVHIKEETLPAVNTLLRNVDAIATGADKGPLGQTLYHVEDITRDAASVMSEIAAASNKLVGDITQLSESLRSELSDPAVLVKKLVAPDSTAAFLLNDHMALYAQIDGILSGVNNSIQQVEDITRYINATTPQITGLIEETRQALDQGKDVLEGLKNNPVLRGGISPEKEQPGTFRGYRDGDF